ncbi:MAG TPA: hypothetical protein VFA18_10370 [Gemmataceae bacterium]|nr:hypothetical protein [Gemmataceae bacterium]
MRFISARELLAKAQEAEAKLAKRIQADEEGIVLDGHYEIAWDRIDNLAKLTAWIHHLTHKQWITVAMLRRIMDLAAEHHGLNIHVNC